MRRVDATQARRNFSRIYHEVAYGGERFIVENHGRGLVALVPARDLDTQSHPREESMHERPPRRDVSLGLLRREWEHLRQAGIAHAAIFGSVARGDARPDSDVDILLELDPDAPLDLFGLAALRAHLIGTFERDVDLVTRGALDADRDRHILQEAVYAF